MTGIADIWEGNSTSGGSRPNGNTIYGIKSFADKIYVVQGGTQTLIKVFSPNGIEIYDIFAWGLFVTMNSVDPYGSFDVIAEGLIVIGPVVFDLERLVGAITGFDVGMSTKDPWVKYSVQRINSMSWITAQRTVGGWKIFLNKKEAYENCLPCAVKQRLKKDGYEFNCIDEGFGAPVLNFNGYDIPRSGGAGPSIAKNGGFNGMSPKNGNSGVNAIDCLQALGEYEVAFNKQNINPKDVGAIGEKISKKCSSLIFGSTVSITEYKREVETLHDEYIQLKINRDQDANAELIRKSIPIVSLIAPLLYEISSSAGDTVAAQTLFADQIFWAPIYFYMNSAQLEQKDKKDNLYKIASEVPFQEFITTLVNAASSNTQTIQEDMLKVGWSIMSPVNRTPIKYDSNSATFFKFPYSCISISIVAEFAMGDMDSICGVETRDDGMLIWSWVDMGARKPRERARQSDYVLSCHKITPTGSVILLDSFSIGKDSSTPILGDTKSAGYNASGEWVIRDYYITDSVGGSIKYVTSYVKANSQMQALSARSNVFMSSNLNFSLQGMGLRIGADRAEYLQDGMLEHDWSIHDLDSGYGEEYAWPGPMKEFDAG